MRDYVLEQPDDRRRSSTASTTLLDLLLPAYEAEGKSYLTIAIGCTGGRHRSVAIAEEIAGRLRGRGVAVRTEPPRHRDR